MDGRGASASCGGLWGFYLRRWLAKVGIADEWRRSDARRRWIRVRRGAEKQCVSVVSVTVTAICDVGDSDVLWRGAARHGGGQIRQRRGRRLRITVPWPASVAACGSI